MMSRSDVSLTKMWRDFGIGEGEPRRRAGAALVEASVISRRPNRTNIAGDKVSWALEALESAFILHCTRGDCRAQADAQAKLRDGKDRETLAVTQRLCHICGGSADRSALQRLAASLAGTGVSRVVVVGGTEQKGREIRSGCPPDIEWRFVDGMKAYGDHHYQPDKAWAQVIVIWTRTPLAHKVSSHFETEARDRLIYVTGTGIESLCEAVTAHVTRRPPPIPPA